MSEHHLDGSPSDRAYWIAIKASCTGTTNVFGVYTHREATAYREEWLRTYPPSTQISAVFRAVSREQAELNAEFFMPTN